MESVSLVQERVYTIRVSERDRLIVKYGLTDRSVCMQFSTDSSAVHTERPAA